MQLLKPPRDLERPGAIADVTLDLAGDVRNREGAELDAPRGIETVDRLDQPDRPDLDEILVLLASHAVSPGEALDERHVLLDQPLARLWVAVLVVLAQERPHGLAARAASAGATRPPA